MSSLKKSREENDEDEEEDMIGPMPIPAKKKRS